MVCNVSPPVNKSLEPTTGETACLIRASVAGSGSAPKSFWHRLVTSRGIIGK